MKLVQYRNNSSTSLDICQLERNLKYYLDNGLQLEPDFQRGHVWTEAQQIAFIEYWIQYLPVPPLYFNWPLNSETYTDLVVVDGLQRLTAFRKFHAGKLLAFSKDITYYKKLHETGDFFFPWIQLTITNIETKLDVLKFYLTMNSSGVQHTKDELDRVESIINNIC